MTDQTSESLSEKAEFNEDYETEPPVPVESNGQIANYADEKDAIPDDLVADEHVAEIGDYTVMRAGITCPRCESNVFYHPLSIGPRNAVRCFNCEWSPFGIVWWETPRLSDYTDTENDD